MTDTDVEQPAEKAVLVEDEDDVMKEVITEEGDEDTSLRTTVMKLFKYALYLLLVVYVLAALIIDFKRATFIFVLAVLALSYFAFCYLTTTKYPQQYEAIETSFLENVEKIDTEKKTAGLVTFVMVVIMVILGATSIKDAKNLISLLGLVVFVLITWALSFKPMEVKWRPVIGSLFVQYVFGYIVIQTSWGIEVMDFLANQAVYLLNYTYAGTLFVFGYLVDGSLWGKSFVLAGTDDTFQLAPPLYFNVLPTVIFFSSFISVLYYLRVLPSIVKTLGYFLSLVLGTSASESLSAAGNIFVGQTEAPLIVKPFIKEMTESEIHAIMTGGYATIAGGVFAVYVSFGVSAQALLASSVMSAPAALAISKLTYPETEESKTDFRDKKSWIIPASEEKNVIHAASVGATLGSQLMLNIASNLIAALALIAMLDAWLFYLGDMVDIYLSFNAICEVIFYPFAWLMGVESADLRIAATLIGYKIFANEFVAYQFLAFTYRNQISARSYYILSYALCGFSNFGSVGIQIGGITPMAPNKEKSISKLALSAMVAGNTACFMTACIAGLFYEV